MLSKQSSTTNPFSPLSSMNMLLKSIDVSSFDIVSNPCYLQRDIHYFVNYIREREVKRAHRSNALSKTDLKRLQKIIKEPIDDWIDYVDRISLRLKFIAYDTEGVYVGYTSQEPCYPDNYIQFLKTPYEQFIHGSVQQQELHILETFIQQYSDCGNEFFSTTPLTQLDKFSSRGCATYILPYLDFASARRTLFNVLAQCEANMWFSTASLIKYMKQKHPYFLIAKRPKSKRNDNEGRYANFKEYYGSRWSGKEREILATDKDAFERVEGRYIERFLEQIPLVLNYVDVAYRKKVPMTWGPSQDQLVAFRVKPKLLRVMSNAIQSPKVTIQPNFEIQIESEVYPVKLLQTLLPLADMITEDVANITLKLQRKNIAEQLAENDELDIIQLLEQLSGKSLPINLATELSEWQGHADNFVVYEGFGLLETSAKLAKAAPFVVETISPKLHIIKQPTQLYDCLEQAEVMPLLITHKETALSQLPAIAKTIFRKQSVVSVKSKAKARKKQIIQREVNITLSFPDDSLLDRFAEDLLAMHCPVVIDKDKRSLTFPKSYETQIKQTIKALSKQYQIQLKDKDI